ncbi:molybdopterin dinucleotide binding domain-containing protein [Desulfosarcina cetonica]|uniref:molybdopterin dinucleotide binding domain-containing protein n=1 Tax=Desulfosarcina cetonica TaxID=90730 RepID=UPI0006D00E6C|nr:molybdopterin dinucleotide binding domain-containing protein [Desulfosarcina cetonica]
MNRRTFLKIASMGSVAFAAGCSAKTEDNLFTMVQATEDMVTGRANWYASTCRECPAGCGVLAKNREGRVIKLEGNPLHPVNRGALCMRGQAALQGVYHPDRLKQPQLKTADGWQEIPFYKAKALVVERFNAAAAKGDGQVAMLTETVGRTQLDLFTRVLAQAGGRRPVIFEPLAHEALKFAHAELGGQAQLPTLRLDQADLLVGFGADFLETWLSPVEYARKFKAMHGYQKGRKGVFLQVSPFQSLTGANADRWIACRPGSEAAVIMGLIRMVIEAPGDRKVDGKLKSTLMAVAADYPPEAIEQTSGVSPKALKIIADQLIKAKHPLVLGVGAGSDGSTATAAELAALFLNLVLDPALSLFDFSNRHRVEIADRRSAVMDFFESLQKNKVGLVFLNNVNPVFALAGGARVAKILGEKKRFVVAFDNFLNETTAEADLIIPVQMALETWNAYESNGISLSTLQPAMGRINQAPAIGDVFLALLPADKRPAENYQALVTQTVLAGTSQPTAATWLTTIQQGGRFNESPAAAKAPAIHLKAADTLKRCLASLPKPGDSFTLLAPPSIRFFDGRGANRPWLIETPDTLTQIPWQTPVLIHPQTMQAAGIQDGDRVVLKTKAGELEAPAYGYAGLFARAVMVPTGQGHTTYGRWGSGQGVNPLSLMAASLDADAGQPAFATALTSLEKGRGHTRLAITSGSRTALDRKIAPTVAMAKVASATRMPRKG